MDGIESESMIFRCKEHGPSQISALVNLGIGASVSLESVSGGHSQHGMPKYRSYRTLEGH